MAVVSEGMPQPQTSESILQELKRQIMAKPKPRPPPTMRVVGPRVPLLVPARTDIRLLVPPRPGARPPKPAQIIAERPIIAYRKTAPKTFPIHVFPLLFGGSILPVARPPLRPPPQQQVEAKVPRPPSHPPPKRLLEHCDDHSSGHDAKRAKVPQPPLHPPPKRLFEHCKLNGDDAAGSKADKVQKDELEESEPPEFEEVEVEEGF